MNNGGTADKGDGQASQESMGFIMIVDQKLMAGGWDVTGSVMETRNDKYQLVNTTVWPTAIA